MLAYQIMEFAVETWDFNKHPTDTLRYHQNDAAMCFILLAAITNYSDRE